MLDRRWTHHHQTRLLIGAALALACSAMFAAATSSAHSAQQSSAKKKINLTAVTKKDKNNGQRGEKFVFALQKNHKTVGKVIFPNCAGTSSSIVCGGTVNLKGVGSHLSTIVTFGCLEVPPFTCQSGTGGLDTKGGKFVGSIRLKVHPSAIKKGKRFPVVVFVRK